MPQFNCKLHLGAPFLAAADMVTIITINEEAGLARRGFGRADRKTPGNTLGKAQGAERDGGVTREMLRTMTAPTLMSH